MVAGEWRLTPSIEQIESLLAFATGPQLLGVHLVLSLGEGNEKARVHYASRRRGGSMTAPGNSLTGHDAPHLG
jgi:hypothetical protein